MQLSNFNPSDKKAIPNKTPKPGETLDFEMDKQSEPFFFDVPK